MFNRLLLSLSLHLGFSFLAVLAQADVELVVSTVVVYTEVQQYTTVNWPENPAPSTLVTATRSTTPSRNYGSGSPRSSQSSTILFEYPTPSSSSQLPPSPTTVTPSSTLSTLVHDAVSIPAYTSAAWSGQDFQEIILNSTNVWRANHNANAVTWNDTLAQFAYNHSQACIWEHSHDGPYGENLALNYAAPAEAVDDWGFEDKEYDYAAGVFGETTGHFTQLVWKDTSQVGCAAVNCSNDAYNGAKGWFLTCEYYPPGNVQGYYTKNVSPAVDSKKRSVGKRNRAAKHDTPLHSAALTAGIVGSWFFH